MARQLQFRRGDLSWWTTANPVLADGEFVLVSTNNDNVWNAYKIGDGVSAFSTLPLREYTGVLGYGSPQGVYSTLEDLIAANPNRMYIYIVQADGNWYYWDTSTSQWTTGGLYQTPLSVVQTIGQSQTDVISQKGYTDYSSNAERATADILAHLLGRIETLEQIIASSIYTSVQANTVSAVDSLKYKGAEMILTGTAAPDVTPDFVGQFFVNTTGGVTYQAKGITNSGDWKQTSN